MCVTVNVIGKDFLCFDQSEYLKEIELMHKRMEKLLKKVEKNDSKFCYEKFKEGLKKIDHENLKK